MELDQKVRYASFALAVASFALLAMGVYAHAGLHVRALEVAGRTGR
jgi:hypothetical protein